MQRVGPMVHVPGLLAKIGVDPEPVVASVGLDLDTLSAPDNLAPFAALASLLAEAVRAANCPHFGLLVGSSMRLAEFGVLGQIMAASATVGEALRSYTLYQRLYSQGASAYFTEYAHSATLGYSVHHPLVHEALPVAHDVGMSSGLALMRDLWGAGWEPSEVLLPRSRPVDAEPYRLVFRCPVRFDSPQAALRFPLAHTRRALASADPTRKRLLEDAVAQRLDDELVPLLYRSLRLLLLEGQASGEALVRQLAIHRRTLNRRLAARGTTFKAVLDSVRFDVARQLLRDTRMPMLEISGAVGYAEGSCFTRAFRGWSGLPPAEWRALHQPANTPAESPARARRPDERPAPLA
jgi:AraC-like DNA-binding protein